MSKPKKQVKRVKAWAVVSRGGVLIGGGDRRFGYTELAVYSTSQGAKSNMSPTRPTDIIVPATITYSLPPPNQK